MRTEYSDPVVDCIMHQHNWILENVRSSCPPRRKLFVCTWNTPIRYVFISPQNQEKPSYNTVTIFWPSQSVSKHTISLFLMLTLWHKNIQPIMAPLPSFGFPTAETEFPIANSGVDFFGPFYVDYFKRVEGKHYGLIFTCSSLRNVSRPKHRYVSQCLQKILQSSMPVQTSLQRTWQVSLAPLKNLRKLLKHWTRIQSFSSSQYKVEFQPPYGLHFGAV